MSSWIEHVVDQKALFLYFLVVLLFALLKSLARLCSIFCSGRSNWLLVVVIINARIKDCKDSQEELQGHDHLAQERKCCFLVASVLPDIFFPPEF